MKVKLLHPLAQMPEYATEGAAAFDIRTVDADWVLPMSATTFSTGIAVEIPQGHALMLFSRSGHGFKHGLRLGNAVGIIDADYRGEIKVRIHNDSRTPFSFEVGDRIAQGIVIPVSRTYMELVHTLTDTSRGDGGFGSTGA
jgi:dUTP pyrophosphatase